MASSEMNLASSLIWVVLLAWFSFQITCAVLITTKEKVSYKHARLQLGMHHGLTSNPLLQLCRIRRCAEYLLKVLALLAPEPRRRSSPPDLLGLEQRRGFQCIVQNGPRVALWHGFQPCYTCCPAIPARDDRCSPLREGWRGGRLRAASQGRVRQRPARRFGRQWSR
jgi:hypothetical protein